MAYDESGLWKPEDDSVSSKVTGLMSAGNPLIDQARSRGKQYANSRGLMNSSIGAGAAEAAAYDVALPIASQEASQIAQKNLSAQEFTQQSGLLDRQLESQEGIAQMNVAAHDREKAAAFAASAQESYAEMFRTIGSNDRLPSDVRDQYLESARAMLDQNMNLVEQMYGIDLDWVTLDTGEDEEATE